MGNCLSKCDNETFTLYTTSLTSGHHKKIKKDIQKNNVKIIVSGIQKYY